MKSNSPKNPRLTCGICILWVALGLALSGCASTPSSPPAEWTETAAATENRLRVGDELIIRIATGGRTQQNLTPQEQVPVVVDENGEVSLPLIGRVQAAGLTPGELAERIEAHYVPRYYVRCSVSVQVQARFFYVGGEVRAPGRYPWSEDMTLLKAINTAASFTDYANRRRVEIIRGKEKRPVDVEAIRRNPALDVPIRPGDSIWVPRSVF
ncbi:MAG: polysaccharide export protein [Verrucomicrobiae bacterium]|nr:polysaccharide export protein [Verrucomicrobiae bacterium]